MCSLDALGRQVRNTLVRAYKKICANKNEIQNSYRTCTLLPVTVLIQYRAKRFWRYTVAPSYERYVKYIVRVITTWICTYKCSTYRTFRCGVQPQAYDRSTGIPVRCVVMTASTLKKKT